MKFTDEQKAKEFTYKAQNKTIEDLKLTFKPTTEYSTVRKLFVETLDEKISEMINDYSFMNTVRAKIYIWHIILNQKAKFIQIDDEENNCYYCYDISTLCVLFDKYPCLLKEM